MRQVLAVFVISNHKYEASGASIFLDPQGSRKDEAKAKKKPASAGFFI
jgi:hypothetical protein